MAIKFNDLEASEKKRVAELIIERRVSLFVGSGISKDSTSSFGKMELAGELRDRLVKFKDLPSNISLQRAYSFLDAGDIQENLTDRFICTAVGPTAAKISDIPWRRIYTLNIDNCLEMAFDKTSKKRKFAEQDLEVKNFCDPFSELSSGVRCSIIHLHGCVDRPNDGYIFSVNEYAKSLTMPNSWMLTLCQQIRTDMFIFAGTSLDEIDVEYYLEQRSQQGSRSDLPKSILVEPYPTKITEKICEDHDFVLFPGTINELIDNLTAIDSRIADPWTFRLDDGLSDIDISDVEKLKFSSSFDTIPKEHSTHVSVGRFLLGSELTWDMIHANADMARDASGGVRKEILEALEKNETRLYLLLDQPGSGKTSFLKRLAFEFSRGSYQVFWHSGLGMELEPRRYAEIFDKIPRKTIVFVDNFADSLNTISLILEKMEKKDIIFVGAERDYRLGYIEGSFSGEEYVEVSGRLRLTKSEAFGIRNYHESAGLSTIQKLSDRRYLSESISRPIVEVSCRIQNSFKQIDNIVDDLSAECTASETSAYLTVALARYCFSNGVRRSCASEISDSDSIEFLLSDDAPLSLKYSDFGKTFLTPKNALVGDRILSKTKKSDSRKLLKAFSDLAVSIAPRVNASAIKRKSPEAQLLGRLMDYDNNVKRFIDDYAEEYYGNLKKLCGWNARYWEQISLLKLDRFLASPEDTLLLEESIQHARSAIAAETHPFSLATLAKVLFKAMERTKSSRDTLFEEAWANITDADDRERRWSTRGATVFVICFSGVQKYIEMGGLLTGEQSERLRDMISETHRLKFKDKGIISRRESLQEIIHGRA